MDPCNVRMAVKGYEMKQVFIQHGKAQLRSVPRPMIEQGHILVEVAYSLISTGTELMGLDQSGKSLARQAVDSPEKIQKVVEHLRRQGIKKTISKIQTKTGQAVPTGYACSGIIVQVGEGVTSFLPGDRVACAGAGVANHAEIVLVPTNLAAKVPQGCDLREAASATLGSIAMQGVRRADPRLGEFVAVVGLGLLGQITAQLLKAAGCRVIGFDLDPRRVEIAKQVGIDLVFVSDEVDIEKEIRHLTSDHGVDSTIIAAASQSDAVVQLAMQITRKKGRVVVVGAVGLGLKRSPFYEKELDFLISSSYGPGRYDHSYEKKGLDYPYAYVRWTENRNMAEYLRLMAEGKIQLTGILEREFEVANVSQAYEELNQGQDKPLGVLLSYGIDQDHVKLAKKLATKVRIRTPRSSDKIKIAIIGAGNFARGMHLPNLQTLSDVYQIKAVVCATGSNAMDVANEYDADYGSTKLQDVLDDGEVDALLISTRHNLHAEQTVAGLQAGKHILCEKPLALNREQLDSILKCYGSSLSEFEAGDSNIDAMSLPFLMVGYNRRFAPASVGLRKQIQGNRTPKMILYRVNAGYLPLDHWAQTDEGGGRILGEACHMLDFFQYVMGDTKLDQFQATSIVTDLEHLTSKDNFTATLRYLDGSIATLIYTSLGSDDLAKENVETYADGKTYVLDDYKELRVYGAKGGWRSGKQDKGHLEMMRVFARVLNGVEPMPTPLEDLIETTLLSIRIDEMLSAQEMS